MRGPQKKMRLVRFFILPACAARKRQTISYHVTASLGDDCETVQTHESPELMAATAENYSLGLPVEIGKIEKELKKLWAESEGAMTRASLMNLAAYSEQPGSLNNNTQLMA